MIQNYNFNYESKQITSDSGKHWCKPWYHKQENKENFHPIINVSHCF